MVHKGIAMYLGCTLLQKVLGSFFLKLNTELQALTLIEINLASPHQLSQILSDYTTS